MTNDPTIDGVSRLGTCAMIQALLDIDARGSLAPHGIGGLARDVLTKAKSTIASLEARIVELERCKMSIWPSEEILIAAGLGYPIGKEQAVKIYKASLQSRTDTPENADCEWCYGAGHDYYGDPCCGCCQPDQGKIAELVSELDRPAPKPFAYTTTGFIGLAKTHGHTGRLVASFQENVFWNQPLFTAPPPPVAVVLPLRRELPPMNAGLMRKWSEGWNDCLDATAALNNKPSTEVKP